MKHKPRNRPDGTKRQKFSARKNSDVKQTDPDGPNWLWGSHAVGAALANSQRAIQRALLSRNAALKLDLNPEALPPFAILKEPREIDEELPSGAVHQGAAIFAEPLEDVGLDSLLDNPGSPVVILDQVTDPMNIGAILRSAAAFGFGAMIVQSRKSPPFSGVLAKAAVGAVETIKEVRVVNIARAIDALRDSGWDIVGLAGEAPLSIKDAVKTDGPVAIVLGAEGSGLRPVVAKACTQLASIPIHADMESLNVSNAAAIAFYECAQRNED